MLAMTEMANGSDGKWHGMCPYSMARYEHISVGHVAQHGTTRTWEVPGLEF